MALYRDIQFNKGTVTDLMGATGTVTGATFNKDKKGWALQTGISKYVQYDRQLLPDGAFSVVIWARLRDSHIVGSQAGYSISNGINANYGFIISYLSSPGRVILSLNLIGQNTRMWDYIPDKKLRCYILTITGENQLAITNSNLFVNNVLIGVIYTNSSGLPLPRSEFTYLGGTLGGGNTGGLHVSRIKVYDHVLTSKEREREQAEFEAAQPLTYQKRQLSLPKPTELRESGLVAGYNKIRSGIYNDLSASGKHGVVTNCLSTVKGIKLHGVNSKVVLGDIGNVKSISLRIKLKTTTQPILEKAANSGLIHVVSGTLTSLDFANKYVNGVAGTAITANQWHNVTLTSSTDVSFTAATLGLNNTTYGNFEIEDLRFYSITLSIQEIKAYHNSFNEVILHEKFEDMAVDSAKLPNGWIKNGGSFVCGESAVNDAVIKSIRKGTKYLRCVTAGIVAMPIKMERDCTIEFTYYAVGLNIINMFFLYPKSLGVGYSFVINNGGRLGFYRNNGVANILIGETATNFISANTYYRYKIVSTSTQFFMYVLGGIYTNWTPITGSPFTTTDYTRGNYFNINSSVAGGDRVTDILIQSQIKT